MNSSLLNIFLKFFLAIFTRESIGIILNTDIDCFSNNRGPNAIIFSRICRFDWNNEKHTLHSWSMCFSCFRFGIRHFWYPNVLFVSHHLDPSTLGDAYNEFRIEAFYAQKIPSVFFHRQFFFLEKKVTKPDRQPYYKCLPFGYLDRLHEVNRRVWFYLDPVAADKRDSDKVFCGFGFSIDTAWIYKTVQLNAAQLWAVFESQYFLRVDCVYVPDYSTVCKENNVEQ